MSIESALIAGTGAALQTAGAGVWLTGTATLTPGQVGIYDGRILPDTIEGIGLATYPVADPVDSRSIVGLQITFRSASKATLRDRAELVFDTLHAAWGITLGGIRVTHILRQSSADLGIDEAGAHLRTDNYYLTVNHPTPNRP